MDRPSVIAPLARLIAADELDDWTIRAVLTTAEERSGALLHRLSAVDYRKWRDRVEPGKVELVRRLSAVAAQRGEPSELGSILFTVGPAAATPAWWRTAALAGLAEGLPRYRGELGRLGLAALATGDGPKELRKYSATIRSVLDEARRTALDVDAEVGDRLAAIGLLATQPFDPDTSAVLLRPSEPSAIRRAALESLRGRGGVAGAEIVLDAWPTLGPELRGTALTQLLGRTDTTKTTLVAMAEGLVEPSAVDLDLRVRLLRHGDGEIRGLAEKLFGGAVSANRREVAEQYEAALAMNGDVERGRAVFAKTCAKCHRVGKVGHVVGPDISDTSNRPRDALLHDILDPNRKIEPRFAEYSVVTTDGRLFNGLLAGETEQSIVLRRPEGKEDVVQRADIEILKATGKSLMPEGVEKEITVAQMADLLEFLTGER